MWVVSVTALVKMVVSGRQLQQDVGVGSVVLAVPSVMKFRRESMWWRRGSAGDGLVTPWYQAMGVVGLCCRSKQMRIAGSV